MIELRDRKFCNVPWKSGGRTLDGADCVGLTWLWLVEEFGITGNAPKSDPGIDAEKELQGHFIGRAMRRGDLVFFRDRRSKKIRGVAVFLGRGKLLTTMPGCRSRVVNGFELLRRAGADPVGAVAPADVGFLCRVLSDPKVDTPFFVAGIASLFGWTSMSLALATIISAAAWVGASLLSGLFLRGGSFNNRYGRYGENPLLTQRNPQIPLPDVLGQVVVAGNQVYEQLPDRYIQVNDDPPQKRSLIVVLSGGPCEGIDYSPSLQIKGVSYTDKNFYDGTHVKGIYIDPAQTKDEAVTGTIRGDPNVPSISLYSGTHDITVPVDVRAEYDRGFPVYGMAGCVYVVLRAINSTKFSGFNLTCRVKGRKCRTFTAAGFVRSTVTNESLAGADGSKRRFKLAREDIASVSAVTVNSAGFSRISPSGQTGSVFHLNATKGYVEFVAAPANGATILVSYDYFPRVWTRNPAAQLIYLLTEPIRGKGFDESRVDWAAAVACRDACAAEITWRGARGVFTGPAFQTDYVVDWRSPAQDHIAKILDGSNIVLFMSGGQWVLRMRTYAASVFSFDPSNILIGSDGRSTFQAELVDRSAKANLLHVFFGGEDNLNNETEVAVEDQPNQVTRAPRLGNLGVAEANLKLAAVTNYEQCERLGIRMLREQIESRWLYQWKTTIEGLALQPGDTVDVTHPILPGEGMKLLRIESLEYDAEDRLGLIATEVVPTGIV